MISEAEAIDIALDYAKENDFTISGVYEQWPDNPSANVYQSLRDHYAWYISFRLNNSCMLCSTPIIIISKHDGQLIFSGDMGDEG